MNTIDTQTILSTKVAFLSGNSTQDIDDSMKAYAQNDIELQKELAFIEAFWHQSNDAVHEQPSNTLDARFYQMLSQAQAAQMPQSITQPKLTLLQSIQNWISPKPIMQFAMMAAVFTLGFNINSQPNTAPDNVAMQGLQDKVESLNSLVALSMINNSSASKRLTGIDYSRQSNTDDDALNDALIKMLNHDTSTAVRLAAVNAIAERFLSDKVQQQLLDGLILQKPLVQIELVSLFLNHGSKSSMDSLAALVKNQELSDEATEIYQQRIVKQQRLNQI